MAKKKKSIELSDKNIEYTVDKILYKVIRFYPGTMNLDIMVHEEDGSKAGIQTIPFAHVPREIKKTIKPT